MTTKVSFIPVVGACFLVLTLLANPIPVNFQTADLVVSARSSPLGTSNQLFWIPSILLFLISKFIPLTPIALRLLSALVGIVAIRQLSRSTTFFLLSLTSSWLMYLIFFDFPGVLTILWISLLLRHQNNKLSSTLFLFAASFTSWVGVVASISFALIKRSAPSYIFLCVILVSMLVNRGYLHQTLKASFLGSLTPSALAEEINQKPSLPPVIRKITFNKGTVAVQKITTHFVELFDFEQVSVPQNSYSLISLSGLPPKENPQLVTLSVLLMAVYGYSALKSNKRMYSIYITISLIPVLLFSKNALKNSGILLFPIIVCLATLGIGGIQKKHTHLVAGFLLVVMVVANLTSLVDFLANQEKYQRSEMFLAQKLAEWTSNDEPTVVTNRFGRTDIYAAFYRGEKKTLDNLTFTEIDGSKLPSGTVAIGLIGEFVGKGKELDKRPKDDRFEIQETYKADDEPVYQFGDILWKVKVK